MPWPGWLIGREGRQINASLITPRTVKEARSIISQEAWGGSIGLGPSFEVFNENGDTVHRLDFRDAVTLHTQAKNLKGAGLTFVREAFLASSHIPLSSGSCVAMLETDNYYRRRFEEELVAAAQSENPSISQIHLEMARRYRDMLSSDADRTNGDPIMVEPRGGAIADSGAVFG